MTALSGHSRIPEIRPDRRMRMTAQTRQFALAMLRTPVEKQGFDLRQGKPTMALAFFKQKELSTCHKETPISPKWNFNSTS